MLLAGLLMVVRSLACAEVSHLVRWQTFRALRLDVVVGVLRP